MNDKTAKLKVKILVDSTELDEALEKAKELLVTLGKCGQVTLEED